VIPESESSGGGPESVTALLREGRLSFATASLLFHVQFPVGLGGRYLCRNPQTGRLYWANVGSTSIDDSTVSVFDGHTDAATATIAVDSVLSGEPATVRKTVACS
jgi:hypothetical protein